ncbi:FtsX-like permease family protein [candidate division WOR-3 bacterium]|uniref:FtsX-like permease family protein n=1 Tax=candidate division WOR-3 bacterium TaxID=2052148 RepID=A0A9D5K9W4_UNCW3|nr:FtsX-like permease family protein [candidate division WOR-3 bacterium]MBD3365033.1 FtsX-like permease family protein [candidate division WOR-3 bacterium]
MNFFAQLKLAAVSLRYNKSRSFLTTLGIIIGVMTVIAILSLLEGLNRKIKTEFSMLGSQTIFIQKVEWMISTPGNRQQLDFEELRKRPNFSIKDAEALALLPTIEVAVPTIDKGVGNLKRLGNTAQNCRLKGTAEGGDLTSNWVVEEGRFISREDRLHRRMVCVLGAYVADNLFGAENPIDKTIDVENHRYTVIGVLEEKGTMFGNPQDNVVIIPVSTYLKYNRMPRGWRSIWGGLTIEALPKRGVPLEDAMGDVEELLRIRRGLRYDEDNDFGLNTQQMIMSALQGITSTLWIVMIGIAAISLIVGGIGIMNIMLVSVAERTREIGIRKAVGARDHDILLQFLLESVLLAMLGGLVGILIGLGIARLVSALVPFLDAASPWWTVVLGFGFSAAVGIFFGIYPAQKAAKLNPIQAIRYE